MSFLLSPTSCSCVTDLVILVSSSPSNFMARQRWRSLISNQDIGYKVKLVFLVSTCVVNCDHDLVSEHEQYDDIVHSSLRDGHRRLGYKILSGYIWAYLNCPEAKYVLKTDDNVVMDLSLLISTTITSKTYLDDDTILCGSGPPHRNQRSIRFCLVLSLEY